MRFATLLALALALPVAAADPKIVTIEATGDTLVAPMERTEFQPVVVQVAEMVNGQVVVRNVTQLVPVSVKYNVVLDAAAGEFLGRDGKSIEPKALKGILKKGAVIAISTDGKPVDPKVVEGNKEVVAVLIPKKPADRKDPPKPDKK
jgi:hypothetical protein